jgi:hypothetical protein
VTDDDAVSLVDFARGVHLSARHVRRLLAKGLPSEPGAQGPRIRPAVGRAWLKQAKRTRHGARTTRTPLGRALIARQDQFATRWAAQIAQLLAAHVSLAAAEARWQAISHRARARCAQLPDAFVAARPDLIAPAQVASVLRALVEEALAELDTGGPIKEGSENVAEAPPLVRRSRSLADARAQAARLQVRLMQLKSRVHALPPEWPTPLSDHRRFSANGQPATAGSATPAVPILTPDKISGPPTCDPHQSQQGASTP